MFRLSNRVMITGLIALTMNGCEAPGEPALQGTSFQVVNFHEHGSEVRIVPEGGQINLANGECYGWQLSFEKVDAQIKFEELFLLPARATQWAGAEDSRIAGDGMSASTTLLVSGQQGSTQRAWCAATGDPEGIYKFSIRHKGEVVGEGSFRVAR